MKKMFLLSAIVMVFAVANVDAQRSDAASYSSNYTTAIGIKFWPGAFSVKHFIGDDKAIEGLAYLWNEGFRVTGLYEVHERINSAPGLKWYYGGGAHIAIYNTDWHGGGGSVGIDGVLGLDYKFNGAPLDMSLDWQPSVEFANRYGNGFIGNWGGLGIRYVLN